VLPVVRLLLGGGGPAGTDAPVEGGAGHPRGAVGHADGRDTPDDGDRQHSAGDDLVGADG
jgi:hypothetical protein